MRRELVSAGVGGMQTQRTRGTRERSSGNRRCRTAQHSGSPVAAAGSWDGHRRSGERDATAYKTPLAATPCVVTWLEGLLQDVESALRGGAGDVQRGEQHEDVAFGRDQQPVLAAGVADLGGVVLVFHF